MARVSAARPISRRVAGVLFRDGEAETEDPGALAYFRRRPGYTVEAAAPPKKRRARKPKQEQAAQDPAPDTSDEGSDGLDEFLPDHEEAEA
jgi:hypothetical protein